MIRTQSFDDKMMDTRSSEDYDFCDAETSKNCIRKFTPPPEEKITFREQPFMSQRWLSKTVPRRNRSVIRYKINRSLNFDIGHPKKDYFTSPTANATNSPRNNIHLSRSAKILKALNIDYSPMKTGGYKKINKTLNFDSTPSPKKFSSANKSHCHMSNLRLASPSINKTLNFDSSGDSPVLNSPHDTSVESMDENQNQTPSQRNSKVKKSLSYISLSSNGSNASLDFNLLSPSLRTELREKIDDIVQTSMSPDLQLMRKSPGHEKRISDTIVVSTPRNLFNDFSDEEDDRPETPENAIRLIPESMSAIKKSHRKERISGRFAHRIQAHAAKPTKMAVAEVNELRPLTPLTSDAPQTPNYNLRSIKMSHKKDKSRRKSCGYRSEDELSETGSLFDYSALEDEKTDNNNSERNRNAKIETAAGDVSPDVEKVTDMNVDKSLEEIPVESPLEAHIDISTTTAAGPTTPENRIDYLRRIMTDSIKKSHKKLKETNKKSLLRTRILSQQMNNSESKELSSPEDKKMKVKFDQDNNCNTTPTSSAIVTSKDRSCTPENMNSSRLLLAQFSSVKKSHKKDKHRKMGFAQRHIVMSHRDENNSPTYVGSENDTRDSPLPICPSIPLITVTEVSTSKSTFSSSFSSMSSEDRSEYRSLGISALESNEDIDSKSMVSSPNKRKSPHSDENGNTEASSSTSNESRMEYESAEDEFKIFTPIKKRKPLVILSTPKVCNNNNSPEKYPENSLPNGRCDTPKIGLGILTSGRKNNSVVLKDDTNGCPKQAISTNTENANGRLTPENDDRLERISALSSIKKSHKKDKWANARRRSARTMKETTENVLECGRATNNCVTNIEPSINNWRPSRTYEMSSDSGEKTESFDGDMSPKPSTSYSGVKVESNSPIKTPPNGLEAKKYLHLIQTTSIKRSHRKMRERKKLESIVLDPNLSDDGSLFDETERSFNGSAIEPLGAAEIDDNHDFIPFDCSNAEERVHKKMHYSKGSHSFSGNRSNDGSIFGSDGDMDSPC